MNRAAQILNHLGPRRMLTLAVSAALVTALYAAADWHAVATALSHLDMTWFAAAMLMFVPQTLVSAARWRVLVAMETDITLADAVRQTLAASAANLILPAKAGDLTKAGMIPVADSSARWRLGRWAVFEKATDVAALAGWLLAGALGVALGLSATITATALAIGIGWSLVASRQRANWRPGVLLATVAFSTALWSLHLVQIHFMLHSAGVTESWQETLFRVPPAIFAGLLPLTSCGIGTRDATLVWMFRDIAPASQVAAVGVLTALRYLVPGAIGIALVGRYLPGRSAESAASALPQSTA